MRCPGNPRGTSTFGQKGEHEHLVLSPPFTSGDSPNKPPTRDSESLTKEVCCLVFFLLYEILPLRKQAHKCVDEPVLENYRHSDVFPPGVAPLSKQT